VELDVRDGATGLDDDLRLAFELEGSGWKTENGTAIVSRPETLRFYEDLARWAARRGLLRLFFLRVDGRPIAVEIVLVAGRRSFDLKGGYDPEFRKYAPGRVMRDLLLAWAEQNGIETHEFLGEPEAWKLERSHGLWTRYELVAVKGRLRGRAARAALVHGRPLVRRARDVAGRLAQRGGAR
jgi:CelD/BcsL family acetyltransferase involved in cellulose biosynthesis